MVRRNQYGPDDVVAAALDVVREHGMGRLSARLVATRLGASTAPVYSNFASMDDLARAVRREVADLMLAEASVVRSGEPFLDMGVGVLEFARREPALYDAVFGAAGGDDDMGEHVMRSLLGRMESVESLAGLEPAERLILLRKMAIFTHGLAVQVTAGRVEATAWQEVLTLLSEAGRAMVTDAFNRPPRTEAEIALLAHLCEARRPAGMEPAREDRT